MIHERIFIGSPNNMPFVISNHGDRLTIPEAAGASTTVVLQYRGSLYYYLKNCLFRQFKLILCQSGERDK